MHAIHSHFSYIHWFVNDEIFLEKLCTFDLDKETFQLFPSPAEVESWDHFHCLAILKGCLCQSDSHGFQFTIWVMKEYGSKKS